MPKKRGLAVKRSHWVIGGSDNRKASAQPNADSFRTALLRRAFFTSRYRQSMVGITTSDNHDKVKSMFTRSIRLFSSSQCTSSRSCGTFCTSSMTT